MLALSCLYPSVAHDRQRIRSFTATPNTRNSLRIVLLGAASFLVFVGLNSGARSQAIPVSCSVDTSNDFACGAPGLASATGGFATAIGGELPIAVARATAVGAGATALSVGTTAIGSEAIADGAVRHSDGRRLRRECWFLCDRSYTRGQPQGHGDWRECAGGSDKIVVRPMRPRLVTALVPMLPPRRRSVLTQRPMALIPLRSARARMRT